MLESWNSITRYLRLPIKKHALFIACIALYLVSSYFFRSEFLYNWDAGQFALGTERYSLSEHQPHPPGYFLFVFAGRIFNIGFHNINTALVFINIVAGLFAVIYLYKFLRLVSDHEMISFFGVLFFIVNPVFWFYHSVALTYTFEALVAIVLSYLTYRQREHQMPALPISVFFTFFIAGFRPSVIIIAFPFLVSQFFYSLRKAKDLLLALLAGFLGGIIWFPIFAISAGGVMILFRSIVAQLVTAQATIVYDINQKMFLLRSTVYSLHLTLIPVVLFSKRIFTFLKNKRLFFLPLAIIWQITVYTFLHFGEVGYILSVVPLFYVMSIPVIQQLSYSKLARLTYLMIVVVEILIFIFGVDLIRDHKIAKINYRDIKTHDQRIGNFIRFIKNTDPKDTLVIILRGQYLSTDGRVASYPYDDIRLLSYYLPDYQLYDLLGVQGIYFVSYNYTYTQINQSEINVPTEIKNVIFLADYMHPRMRPLGLNLQSLYNDFNTNNIYWGRFDRIQFEYNGMIFKKMVES